MCLRLNRNIRNAFEVQLNVGSGKGVTVATIRFNPSSLSTQTFLPSKIVRSLKRHLDIHNIQMTSLRRPLKAFMRRFYQKWNKDLS